MKKLLLALLIGVAVLCSGCVGGEHSQEPKENSAKLCRIEVMSAEDDTLVTTIDKPEMVQKLLHSDEWEVIEDDYLDVIPQYKMIVYQEKTLLQGENPDDEREYEVIEEITTYQDSTFVKESISPNVIKNMNVPAAFLTQYYRVPDQMMDDLHSAVESLETSQVDESSSSSATS